MITRRGALGLLCAPALNGGIQKWGWDQRGARFELSDGSGEILWISPSSFRLVRRWTDSSPSPRSLGRPIEFTAAETGDHVLLQTKYITVRVDRSSFRVRVTTSGDDRVLLEEVSPARRASDGVELQYTSQAGEEFFGLGPRTDSSLSARGSIVRTDYAMLISTAGYGMYHPAGSMEFDFRSAHRVKARNVDRVEYCFYFGPSPKEILQEHQAVRPMRASGLYRFDVRKPGQVPKEGTLLAGGEPSWELLAGTVRSAVHASLSGLHVPVFDATAFAKAPAQLRARALQLAAVMPVVLSEAPVPDAIAMWRRKLTPFLITYVQEADDRGLPVLHPLPLQFPSDKESPKHSTEFLLGDELLVAAITTPTERRPVYLPMGLWTDLTTNLEHRGRRVVELEAGGDTPVMLAKNGSIVPLARPDGVIELHYFPNLGAEFMLYEPEAGDSSQFHAAPAGDYMRLEIESKVDRKYEWVIHHRGAPRKVEGPGVAHHDAERNNLHVTMDGPTKSDRIVNLLL
jgi:alpha-glucosidase (family GH31 glycosyl hydrolase)